MQKRTKESQKRINSLILLIAFTAILLIVSTYAWFTTQKDVTLSNIKATIEVAEGLQISLDGDTWGQEFNLDQVDLLHKKGETGFDSTKTYGVWDNNVNFLPTELKPVSTDGVYLEEVDGQKTLPFYSGKLEKGALTEINYPNKTTESAAITAATADDLGYIAFDIFLKDTSKEQDGTVPLQLDANSFAWSLINEVKVEGTETVNDVTRNITRRYNGDWTSGIQNTVRVGFAFYDHTTASEANEYGITATQDQIDNWAGGAKITDVAIWEPNADRHSYQAMQSNNKYATKFRDIILTRPTGLGDGSDVATVLATDALDADAIGKEIADVYAISSETNEDNYKESEIVTKAQTLQTTHRAIGDASGSGIDPRIAGLAKTAFDEVNVIAADNPYYTHNLKGVDGDTVEINRNQVTKCRVYVWLEGQDVDCINYASYGGGIQLDIGLCKDREIIVTEEGGSKHGNNDKILLDDADEITDVIENPIS